MGSPAPHDTPAVAAPSQAPPESLARLVLRFRDLSAFLEAAVPELPSREAAPFLYSQLDDALQRLQSCLRALAPDETERAGGFLRRLAGRKRETPRRNEPRYDLEGNAWTIPVTELVGFLSHSGKSGLLWVTSQLETFVLEFSQGNLVHATSNSPPVAFRLGEILLGEKLLEPEELARVIDHAKAADDLLGSYLVRTGRLRYADLQRVLTLQVQQLFHRLMDAENAVYRFQEGAHLLRSQSLEVNITSLLLESARKKDEERMPARTEGDPGAAAGALAALEEAPAPPAEGAPGASEPAAALPHAPEASTAPPAPEEEEGSAPAALDAAPSPARSE
jgi:hypothetical protein